MVFARQNIEITTDGPEYLFDYEGAFFMMLVIFQIKEENDLLLISYDASQFANVVKLYINKLGRAAENLPAFSPL